MIGHLEVPVSIVTLRGEVWTGDDTQDLRGGIGQGIALTDADGDGSFEDGETIKASGGWAHVNVAPIPWYSVTLGAGIDKPKDIAAGGRAENITIDFANVFSPWKPVKLGLLYNRYQTKYEGGETGKVNRFCGYTMVSC